MNRLAAAALLSLAVVSCSLLAQNDSASLLDPDSAPPTLRTGTQIVILDVTVTGRNHQPVHNLTQQDFTVLEDNSSQAIKSFEEHVAPSAADLAKAQPMPPMPPRVFTNFTPAPALARGPVNVLLIDRLNTSMQDQTRLRKELVDYLKKSPPGARVAIFGLNTQLVLLQGFTDDRDLLLSVLDHKLNAQRSPLQEIAASSGGHDELLSDKIDAFAAKGGDGLIVAARLSMMAAYTRIFEASIDSQRTTDRALRTLEAMNSLARYLVNIPGRKNLLWFSGSFPLDILPDSKIGPQTTAAAVGTDFINVANYRTEYRETISLLSRAEVSVYPIDDRGMNVLPTSSVAGEGADGARYLPFNHGPATAVAAASGNNAPSPTDLLAGDIDTAMNNIFDENTTMRDLAWETGGRAFLNSNDLSGSVRDALQDGSSYYTLTYSPSKSGWDGSFRKIEVRLRQQGYTLSYRRGYYADDPIHPPSDRQRLASGRAVTGPLTAPDFTPMHLALMHGGPGPTDIVFSVKVAPVSDTLDDKIAPGNEGSKALKPPYRRYGLDFTADPRNMAFSKTADGVRHGNVEFVAFLYDTEGTLINAQGTALKLDFNDALVQQVLQHGMPFHQEISLPRKGEYFLRLVVHDLRSDHVGAVEVAALPDRDPTPPGPGAPPTP